MWTGNTILVSGHTLIEMLHSSCMDRIRTNHYRGEVIVQNKVALEITSFARVIVVHHRIPIPLIFLSSCTRFIDCIQYSSF